MNTLLKKHPFFIIEIDSFTLCWSIFQFNTLDTLSLHHLFSRLMPLSGEPLLFETFGTTVIRLHSVPVP